MQSAKGRILLLLIVVVLVASAARAEVGGRITGAVKDQTGSVIPGATVVVTNTQTGVKLITTADQDGVFTFPVLSVGQYQIDVTSDAFKSFTKTGLVIDAYFSGTKVRWILDKGPTVALWGARRPDQLKGIDAAFGWNLSADDLRLIDALLAENITDPVGPEFMAPPSRREP